MITSRINILAMAGGAKPNPKMGQALGPLGINMMQFCKDFNTKTAQFNNDVPLRVILHGTFAQQLFYLLEIYLEYRNLFIKPLNMIIKINESFLKYRSFLLNVQKNIKNLN